MNGLKRARRSRLRWLSGALTLVTATHVSAQGITPAPGSWPMPGRDPQHTAWAPGTGHLTGTASERWTYYVGGDVGAGASIVADVNGDGVDEVLAIVGGKVVARDLHDVVVWDSPPLGLTEILAFTDLNGDRSPEVVGVRNLPAGAFVLSGRDGSLLWQRHDFDDPAMTVGRGIALSRANARVIELAPGATAPHPALVLRVGGGDGNLHAFDFTRDLTAPVDAWNFLGPAQGWWMQHVGLGDFDGDGRTDAMAALNGRTIRLLSGSADPATLGRALPGTDFVTDDGGQSVIKSRAIRLPGAANDSLFFFLPSAFGRIDAAHTSDSRFVSFRNRDAAGHGLGDINHRVVSAPSDPVMITAAGAYLVVNLFDDHDCEQRTPSAAATCSDLDGINDPPASHQWHTAVFDATTLSLVTQISGQFAVALLDVDGDGRPEILTQTGGSDYATRPVSSVTAWRLATPTGAPASLSTVWAVPNSGLAGLLTRADARVGPGESAPLVIASGSQRYLLLYQGDPASTSIGVPVGLQLVELGTGRFFSRTAFAAHVNGRPVGLARSSPELTAPDTIVVSESDGFFHLFASDFMPPRNTAATLGLVHSGGYISPLAAAHLLGSSTRLADLVTNRSDGSLNTVPVAGAAPDRPPTETVRYYGGMFQTPLVVGSEDTPPEPRVIVGNRLGASQYIAALSPLSPLEVWTSDPFPVAPGGAFLKFPPAVGDANGDGVADLFVPYDGTLASGAVSCCGSSFYNVVSGRSVGGSARHPLLWSHPFSPDAIGHGQCCWEYGSATADVNADGHDDLVIAANASMAVRTGLDAADMAQILYRANSFLLPSPSNPATMAGAQYGAAVVAHFDPSVTLSAMMGAGPEGGWSAGVFNLTPSASLATADGEYALPEFSEGTVREGAVASFETPASHAPAALVGFGFGSIYGNFYALDPARRTAGSRSIPLRWARCLHDGRSDAETGAMVGVCPAGQALSNAAAADIDGDGRDEFLVGSEDGYLYALRAADGSLAFAYNFHTAVGAPIVADVDGDGSLGIMVSAGDGYVHSLGTSSATALISMAHVTPVSVTEAPGEMPVITAPTPDVTAMTSESLSYLAAAWTDPSPSHDTLYQARVLTAFGSPVIPWTSVSRAGTSATVTWIGRGAFTLGQRYIIEVSARPPSSARGDLAATNVVQIVDTTGPTLSPVMVGATTGPRIARITATATDPTGVVRDTIEVSDSTGRVVYSAAHATTGTAVSISEFWTPDAVDVDAGDGGAGPGVGPYSVTVTASDSSGHTATGTARFDFASPDASVDAATDIASDIASDVATDVASDIASDVVSDAASDVVTDASVDAAKDVSVTDVAITDGAPATDASDATTSAEAGVTAPASPGGCGCAVPGGTGDNRGLAALAIAACVAVRRRRRAKP